MLSDDCILLPLECLSLLHKLERIKGSPLRETASPHVTNYEKFSRVWDSLYLASWMSGNSFVERETWNVNKVDFFLLVSRLYNIQNNLWLLEDMEFSFSCSTRHLMHEWGQRIREISSSTRDEKFHISKQPCINLSFQKYSFVAILNKFSLFLSEHNKDCNHSIKKFKYIAYS